MAYMCISEFINIYIFIKQSVLMKWNEYINISLINIYIYKTKCINEMNIYKMNYTRKYIRVVKHFENIRYSLVKIKISR